MICATACDPGDVRHLLDGCLTKKSDSRGEFNLDQITAEGKTFKITDDAGKTVCAYVLRGYGPLLWILAAAGRAKFDLAIAIMRLSEQQASHFDEMGFRTERRGLVRKALREGFHIHSTDGRVFYMRKKL